MDVVLVHTRHEPMEATCLAIIMIADRQVVVAGMANHLGLMLCLYPTDEFHGKERALWVKIGMDNADYAVLTVAEIIDR